MVVCTFLPGVSVVIELWPWKPLRSSLKKECFPCKSDDWFSNSFIHTNFKNINLPDFLVESLKDAIELVVNALIGSRDRQISNTSSIQTTSGVISCSDNDVPDTHRRHRGPVRLVILLSASRSGSVLFSPSRAQCPAAKTHFLRVWKRSISLFSK